MVVNIFIINVSCCLKLKNKQTNKYCYYDIIVYSLLNDPNDSKREKEGKGGGGK